MASQTSCVSYRHGWWSSHSGFGSGTTRSYSKTHFRRLTDGGLVDGSPIHTGKELSMSSPGCWRDILGEGCAGDRRRGVLNSLIKKVLADSQRDDIPFASNLFLISAWCLGKIPLSMMLYIIRIYVPLLCSCNEGEFFGGLVGCHRLPWYFFWLQVSSFYKLSVKPLGL